MKSLPEIVKTNEHDPETWAHPLLFAAAMARIDRLEGALKHIASGEGAFNGGTYCSEHARAALASAEETGEDAIYEPWVGE